MTRRARVGLGEWTAIAAIVHATVLLAGSRMPGPELGVEQGEAMDRIRRYLAASEERDPSAAAVVPETWRYPESQLDDGRSGEGSGGAQAPARGTEEKAAAGDLSRSGTGKGGPGKGNGTAQAPAARVPRGRLPPEVIQRVVRQNFGRFRLCAEEAINPWWIMMGRVTVRFVIGPKGAVTWSAVEHNDAPSSKVGSCIARAFKSLQFPAPEGGVVTVSYPIMFSPGG